MVGFAGSRDLDDRRRRRLAQEAESAERRPPVKPVAPVVAAPVRFASSPIESVVRPQAWVNVLLVVLGLAVSGGAIFLGEWTTRHHAAAEASFGPRGLLIRSLAAVYFLFGAQLAAAIQWYRTRSRKDFNARYKVWHFVVPGLLSFGFCAATDAHRVFADWAQVHWQIAGAHAPLLLWMIPAGTLLLAMVRLLQTEMRGTAGAVVCLWIATLAAVGNAAVLLDAPLPVDDAVLAIADRSSALLWPLGLLLSLMLYARRVIYITNEPCALPAVARTASDDDARTWLNWWRPRSDAARKSRTAEPKVAVEKARPAKEVAAKPQASDEKARPADVPAKEPAPRLQAVAAAPATKPAAASTESANVVLRTDPVHSTDEDDEDADHHGGHFHSMSKKDRKKLRKQQQRERREDDYDE